MLNVILAEENPSLKDLMLMELNELFPEEVLVRETAAEALNYLSLFPKVQVIITASELGNEDAASLMEEYIKRNKLKTKLIVLGNFKSQLPQTEVISKRTNWKAATQRAINFLLPDYDEEKVFLKKALKWRKQPESSSI
tara:strand:+ start:851 stop:1267 length:417 start_codon:yes stop_codon:yes gene_type:complete